MPRTGKQYDVDDVWRSRVVLRLEELDHNANWLAISSGCPRSMLSELLGGKRSNTTYLPEIHDALNWPAPIGPMLSRDDEELLKLASGLSGDQRARLKERALTMQEEKKKR